jgi:hypothetical protein
MGVLAVYDTVGIQNYIFASNRLTENIGGSNLVTNVFAELLPEVIKEIGEPNMPLWRDGGPLDRSLKAEIVYQGGGNAYVAFADEKTFQDVTKEFLTRVNLTAPGIGIAVAAVETDFEDTYLTDVYRLDKRLVPAKGGFNMLVLAGNQPITKQSGRTGLPASEFYENEYPSLEQKKNEYLSLEQKKKRDSAVVYKKKENVQFVDFDDLAFEKGIDSLIAIIHADGNNMGKRVRTFMRQSTSYSEAVPKIRKLSAAIDYCYKTAINKTIDDFRFAYAEHLDKLRKKCPDKYKNTKDKNYDAPPFLKLINDGDDATFVICGRFALDFAARLLREIENQNDPFEENVIPRTCAGVVLFHSHYPFSKAYKIAEELCESAKKPSRDCEGSYMDFHLHQSGNVAGLGQLRERQYKVDGKTILRRPWRVSSGGETYPNFKWFENNIGSVAELPNNKAKAIRNAIAAGDEAARLAENQLRGAKLPALELPIENDGKTDMSKYAAKFDILELYDTYVNLLNKTGGADDDNQ